MPPEYGPRQKGGQRIRPFPATADRGNFRPRPVPADPVCGRYSGRSLSARTSIKMALSLRFALTTPGRAVVALEADDLRVAMQATDETDALGDLTRAVVTLLEGGERATVVLEDAPGVHEWTFERQDELVQLRIHSWADRRTAAADMVLSQERTVAIVCPLSVIARELVLVLDVLWVGHGPDGWKRLSPRHPYPAAERRRLRQLLAVAARRSAEQRGGGASPALE